MRAHFCNIVVYLMLSCMLFEHAVPSFMIQAKIIEVLQSKGEVESKDSGASSDHLLSFKERIHLVDLEVFSSLTQSGSLVADATDPSNCSDKSIFSPPPNLA